MNFSQVLLNTIFNKIKNQNLTSTETDRISGKVFQSLRARKRAFRRQMEKKENLTAKQPKLRCSNPTDAVVKLRHQTCHSRADDKESYQLEDEATCCDVSTFNSDAKTKNKLSVIANSKSCAVGMLSRTPRIPSRATWLSVRQCACSSLESPFTWLLGWNERQPTFYEPQNSCRLVENSKTSPRNRSSNNYATGNFLTG